MKKLPIAFILTSLAGILDSAYLTIKHYSSLPGTCYIFNGCEKVLGSVYSEIFGVPIALIGVFYYMLMFALPFIYLAANKYKFMNFAARFSIIGFIASLYFVYLQLFVIRDICFYCIISATFSTALFIIGIFILIKGRK